MGLYNKSNTCTVQILHRTLLQLRPLTIATVSGRKCNFILISVESMCTNN